MTNGILFRHCEHLGVDPNPYLLASGPADFETFIDWILRTTKKTHGTISQIWKRLCQSYSILAQQPVDSFTTEQRNGEHVLVYRWVAIARQDMEELKRI